LWPLSAWRWRCRNGHDEKIELEKEDKNLNKREEKKWAYKIGMAMTACEKEEITNKP